MKDTEARQHTLTSQHDGEPRIDVASTRGMLYEAARQIDSARHNVRGASTLSVPSGSGWMHLWVKDVSAPGFRGYRYALMSERSDTIHGPGTSDVQRLVETDADAFFEPQAVKDAIMQAASGAQAVPA